MTQRTARGNPMVFARLEPEDRDAAQEVADERYDGNLSMLVRVAVKEYVAKWRKQRRTEGEAA